MTISRRDYMLNIYIYIYIYLKWFVKHWFTAEDPYNIIMRNVTCGGGAGWNVPKPNHELLNAMNLFFLFIHLSLITTFEILRHEAFTIYNIRTKITESDMCCTAILAGHVVRHGIRSQQMCEEVLRKTFGTCCPKWKQFKTDDPTWDQFTRN